MEIMFKKKKLEIEFWPKNETVAGLALPPVPAKKEIPDWYRKAHKFVPDGKLVVKNGGANTGVKACTSFLDSFLMGYVFKLHCDILVERQGESIDLSWSSGLAPISPRGEILSNQLPQLSGYDGFRQAWELPYGFKVPKGYSILVTQPFNRWDLPTYCTQGIIDADEYFGPGGLPFAIRSDFEGIIRAGTPIAQIVPFKRDDWSSKKIDIPYPESYNVVARNKIYGWYRENIWKKKNFS